MAARGKLVREVDNVPLDAAYVKFGENFDDIQRCTLLLKRT